MCASAQRLAALPKSLLPSVSGIISDPISAPNVIVSVLASPSVISPFAVMLPVATMFPVTLSCVALSVIFSLPAISNLMISSSALSSSWICVSPSPSVIPLTVVVVVNLRTSIKSPVAGAVVNVSVVPLIP